MARRRRQKPVPALGVRSVRRGRAVLGAPVTIDDVGRAGDVATQAHYADPAYYAKTYAGRGEDVAYYVRLARRAGSVLEYGVGNGRIAIPMARAGADVVGIDLSQPMLDDLARRLEKESDEVRSRLATRAGDMRTLRLRRRFPLVIAPFNTILHLYERTDIERFFACVRAHLTRRGRFVFDFSVPRAADLAVEPEEAYGSPAIRHPTTGHKTRYQERFEYDPLRQLMLITMDFMPEGGEPWSVPLTHRQFFPREMEALLHYNGFTDIEWSADFTDRAPTDEVDSMVVSCRAVAGRRSRP